MNTPYKINFNGKEYPAGEVEDTTNDAVIIMSTLDLGAVSHGSIDPNITSIDWYVSENELLTLTDEELIKLMQ